MILALVFVALAFCMCVSILLSLSYQQRFAALCTFILASIVDFVLFRPLILFGDVFFNYMSLKAQAFKSPKVGDSH